MLHNYNLGSKHPFVSRVTPLKVSFDNMFRSCQGFDGQTVLYASDLCTPNKLIQKSIFAETRIDPDYVGNQNHTIAGVPYQVNSSQAEEYFLDSLTYVKPTLTSFHNIQAVADLLIEGCGKNDQEVLQVVKGVTLLRNSFSNYQMVPIEFLQNLKSSIHILKNRYHELEKDLWVNHINPHVGFNVFLDFRMADRYIAWYLLPVLEMILVMIVRYQYLIKVDPCNPIRVAQMSLEGMLMMYIRELNLPISEMNHPGILKAIFNRLLDNQYSIKKFVFPQGSLSLFIAIVKYYRGIYNVEVIDAIRHDTSVPTTFNYLPSELVREIGSYLCEDQSHVNYVLD